MNEEIHEKSLLAAEILNKLRSNVPLTTEEKEKYLNIEQLSEEVNSIIEKIIREHRTDSNEYKIALKQQAEYNQLLDLIYKMIYNVDELQKKECSTKSASYKLRKSFANLFKKTHNKINPVIKNKQEAVSELYLDRATKNSLKRTINEENCYKLFNKNEIEEIIRDAEKLKKYNEANVYKCAKKEDFENLTKLLCQLFFNYNNFSSDDFNKESFGKKNIVLTPESFVNQTITKNTFLLMLSIPELCLSAFPICEESEIFQTFTTEILEEFRTEKEETTGMLYSLFLVKHIDEYLPVLRKYYTRLIRRVNKKILDANLEGLNKRSDTFIVLTGKIWENQPIVNKIISDSSDIRNADEYLDFFRKYFGNIPSFVWKSFNALMGKQILSYTSIKILPNTFTLFDRNYELFTAAIVCLNSIYYTYGYININGEQIYGKRAIGEFDKGGLCYLVEERKLAKELYNPFKYITTFTEALVSDYRYFETDNSIISIEQYGVDFQQIKYNCPTYYLSFLLQEVITADAISYVNPDELIYYIGAACETLNNDYIYSLIAEYRDNKCELFSKINNFLYSFADYMYVKNKGEATNTQGLMTAMFQGTYAELTKWRISFPYNNIISADYINRIHILNSPSGTINPSIFNGNTKIVLPQYMLLDSSHLPKNKPKVDMYNINEYNKTEQYTYTTDIIQIDIDSKNDVVSTSFIKNAMINKTLGLIQSL